MKKILLIISIFLGFAFFLTTTQPQPVTAQVACTADARLCPDGSYVGRTGPNCEFAPCPNASPAPEGCFYQQVRCVTTPCDPILVCPSPTPIASPNTEPAVPCQSDADCSGNGYCYQPPMPDCPVGMFCAQVMPQKYCKVENTLGNFCQSNNDCESGEYCYQPPMPECPAGMACAQVMPAKQCAPLESNTCPIGQNGQIACPHWDPAPNFCQNGTIIPGEVNECGCQMPPTCENPLKADLNNDGKVNISDFTILSAQMMLTGQQTADLNQDGIVNIKDFTIMMSEFSVI